MSRIKRARDANEQNNNEEPTGNGNPEVSGYEDFRNQRIKENMERMQKLGIPDLSQKLKSKTASLKPTPRNPSQRKTQNPLPLPGSPRRSSRLKSLTPVSYSEIRDKKKRNSLENYGIHIREGSQPEIYSEEHDKLLGDCKENWTLFVDGCGADGKRIYDPVKGKTCHQCRKTLGHHTHCIKCNLVQGQFCGDCLYMRYGENVTEANQNPNWICPVCRGICNCSLCRQGKGWMPTGALYRKVLRLGFKSVAHYLIQTRRSQTNLEDSGTETLASPEGSQLSELLDPDKSPDGFSKPQLEDHIFDKIEEKVKDEVQFLVGKYVDDKDNDEIEKKSKRRSVNRVLRILNPN
ncbi:hypothetical protein SLA2020_283640 [Shorea laevis]